MKKALLYKKLKDNWVQCTACNHYCKIAEGKRGICGVRQNIDGDLYLITYGRVAALHLDPIEKKPLYHYLPGTNIVSFGTIGCNFRCDFCQNWQISQVSKKPHNTMYGAEYAPQQIIDFALHTNSPSIAYTYTEPGVFFEYAYDTMKLAHKNGLKNVFVSNGYISKEARKKIYKYLDAANIDIKSFRNEFYQEICGASLNPVLETINDLWDHGIHIELTTLIIPKYNDSEKELSQIANFIVKLDNNIPWHISRFFPSYKMIDILPTPIKTLKMAKHIGKKAGLKHVYIGNI